MYRDIVESVVFINGMAQLTPKKGVHYLVQQVIFLGNLSLLVMMVMLSQLVHQEMMTMVQIEVLYQFITGITVVGF